MNWDQQKTGKQIVVPFSSATVTKNEAGLSMLEGTVAKAGVQHVPFMFH